MKNSVECMQLLVATGCGVKVMSNEGLRASERTMNDRERGLRASLRSMNDRERSLRASERSRNDRERGLRASER